MKVVRGTEVLETIEEIVDPKHTALLVIDIQNDNSSPKGVLASKGGDISWARRSVARVKTVLEEARRLGLVVIFTKQAFVRDGSLESGTLLRMLHRKGWQAVAEREEYELEGTWGSEVLDELEPRPGERQIVKYRSSSFIGTALDFVLKSRGIKTTVIVGMVTEGCVESTVRDANQYDYYPVVLSDCVWSGRQDLHEAALLVMSARYDVMPSDELLKVWRSPRTFAR